MFVCLVCVFVCVGGLAISGSSREPKKTDPEVLWQRFSFRTLLLKIMKRNFVDKGWCFRASVGALDA